MAQKKTGPKRTPTQREADLEKVARMYLQKQTQVEIAEQLGLSRQQIGYDLKEIQKRWFESSVESVEARKAEELARIDRLEREYWDAWERSIGTVTVTTKTAEGGTGTAKQKATIKTEDLNGDPRYLQGVQWCIQKRCEVFGVDAPVKADLTVHHQQAIMLYIQRAKEMTAEQRQARILELRQQLEGGNGVVVS